MNRNMETIAPEERFKKMAQEANSELLNPNAGRITELNGEYILVMAEYEKALASNDEAAEAILKKANAIAEELNKIDPKIGPRAKPGEIPSMDELDTEAQDLTKSLNSPKETMH